eukprot:TRINITY_DN952_c0_g2_i4.p1 TRINITY_DN952_c0_g2~~TRINITY_DN952_c0_g2_i4.p1  ORF type:complete len:402 (+),score=79.32 TRINITY_DN952_c0_g2_i4:253-1458(+)
MASNSAKPRAGQSARRISSPSTDRRSRAHSGSKPTSQGLPSDRHDPRSLGGQRVGQLAFFEPFDGLHHRLSDMPIEVLRLVTLHLPFRWRRILALTEFELATTVFDAFVLEATGTAQTAREIEAEASKAADPVSPEELRAISEVMEDAVTAIHRLAADEFTASAACVEPSDLVLLAQRVVCTVLDVDVGLRTTAAQLNLSSKQRIRQAYRQLLLDNNAHSLPAQIGALDLIWLGACLNQEIYEMMSAFTTIVADDDFAGGTPDNLAQWALLICLWLRRVSQVCVALDQSMHTSYAQRVCKHAASLLHSAKIRQNRWDLVSHQRETRLSSEQAPAGSHQDFIEDFLSRPFSDRERKHPRQFIQSFLQRGHGSPVLADRVLPTKLRASETLASPGGFVMPQTG